MILKKASRKAINYACNYFHYAKSVPNVGMGYSVFENNVWCGVICFGVGATNNIGKPYNLKNGQCIELLRIAMNGKQKNVSKPLSISLRLLKKDAPLCKLLVSYADSQQEHYGTIYQATNWYYTGYSIDTNIILNGKRHHRRSLGSKYGTCSVEKLRQKGFKAESIKTKPKYKYIYPLDKNLVSLCERLSKPYPNASVD